MSPHIIATLTIDDENHHHRNENYSPSSQEMNSPKTKGRILYCRKCEGHGEKVILKNHSPQCPYILCNCKSCEKLNYKRLKSFNKRNKEKIELAAALNAKRHATESSSSVDDEEGYSRRSSFSSKTSTPDMDSDTRTSSTTPITRASPAVMASTTSASSANGLEGRSGSLGHMTVMSYDIWKAKCASEKKRLEEERAKKTSLDPFTRSPSPTPMRKRAHTFVAQPTNRTEDIPVIAPKKMSVDEKGKGKYILLPTIPAMRIFVNDTDEEKPATTPIQSIQTPVTVTPVSRVPQLPMTSITSLPMTTMNTVTQPTMITPTSVLDIPSTSSAIRPFQIPTTTSPMLPRPAPVMASSQMSPFKPVGLSVAATLQPAPLVNNLSTEQSLSSLILHNTVLQQQQQNSQMIQDLLGGPQAPHQPPVDVLSMLRLQQQAAALAAALQAAGVQIPITSTVTPTSIPAPVPLQMIQKTLPTLPTGSLINPFLQSPLFTNPV